MLLAFPLRPSLMPYKILLMKCLFVLYTEHAVVLFIHFRDLPGPLKEQMIVTIGRTFQLRRANSEGLYSELRLCMKRRRLVRSHGCNLL